MQAERGEVFDRPLIRELEPDVRRLDGRNGHLPAARDSHGIFLARIEGAAVGEWGDLVVRREEVVLEAKPPLLSRHEIGWDAERSVRVRDAPDLVQRADQAAADEILVLIAALETVGPQPPRVEVGAPLPRAI